MSLEQQRTSVFGKTFQVTGQ